MSVKTFADYVRPVHFNKIGQKIRVELQNRDVLALKAFFKFIVQVAGHSRKHGMVVFLRDITFQRTARTF